MPYAREEVLREAVEVLRHAVPEERLFAGMTAAERLAGATPEDREQLRRLLAESPTEEPKD